MNYADIALAAAAAEHQLRIVNNCVTGAIKVASGRLRLALPQPGMWSDERDALNALKRELRAWDCRTGKWT